MVNHPKTASSYSHDKSGISVFADTIQPSEFNVILDDSNGAQAPVVVFIICICSGDSGDDVN